MKKKKYKKIQIIYAKHSDKEGWANSVDPDQIAP